MKTEYRIIAVTNRGDMTVSFDAFKGTPNLKFWRKMMSALIGSTLEYFGQEVTVIDARLESQEWFVGEWKQV